MQINFSGGAASESASLVVSFAANIRVRLVSLDFCDVALKIVSSDGATTSVPITKAGNHNYEANAGDIISLTYDGQNHASASCIGAMDIAFETVTPDGVIDGQTTSGSATAAGNMIFVSNAGFAGGAIYLSPAGNVVTVEQSPDSTNGTDGSWTAVNLQNSVSKGQLNTAVAVTGLYEYSSSAKWLRVRLTSYVSGTVSAVLTQKRVAAPTGISLGQSSQTIGNVNVSIGYTDSGTNLASGAVFQGTWRYLNSFTQYNSYNVEVISDQAGTLYIERTNDNGTTFAPIASTATTTVTRSDGTTFQVAQLSTKLVGFLSNTGVRAVFKNTSGATQTFMRLSSGFTD